MNLFDVERFCDRIGKRKGIGIRKRTLYMIGSMSIFFLLGTVLVIPLFDGRSGLDVVGELIGGVEEQEFVVGDEPPVDSPAFDYWYAPSNSFGISETKTVNWSHFKQLFRNNFQVSLEYRISDTWVENNDYLGVNFDWQDEGYWKINLSFIKPPSPELDVRFTVGMNKQVVDYVEKAGQYEYWLNYTANNTEVYNCFFNWSDLMSIPNLIFNHGVQDNLFWFRFRKDDVAQNDVEKVYVFDPIFGYADDTEDILMHSDASWCYLKGSWAECPVNCVAASLSITTADVQSTNSYQCALYEYIDYSSNYVGALVAVTETKEITSSDDDTLFTFNFVTPPSLSASTKYYMLCRVTTDVNPLVYFRGSATAGYGVYDSDGDPIPFNDPLTGEAVSASRLSIYCIYSNIPVLTNPIPVMDVYNQSVGTVTCNLTVNDADGDTMNISFLTSNDNISFTHQQVNSSVNNGSYEFDYIASNYDTIYYWKVTVDDGILNESTVYNFETTPYRTLYFNDTFPTENWIDSDNNMTHNAVDGWENFTYGYTDVGGDADATAYCACSGSSNTYYISRVRLGDIDKSSGGTAYADYTDNVDTMQIGVGKTITILKNTDTYNWGRTVWVDWNNDDDFADSGEEFHISTVNSVEEVSGTITPPADAVTGVNIVMRLTIDYNKFADSSCGDLGSGEAEDYTIYVQPFRYDAWILSDEIFKTEANWDTFDAHVNQTLSCSFALIDPNDHDHNITSGLTGNGDDISSVTNASVMIFGNFSDDSVNMASWNISWASSGGNNAPTFANEAPTNGTDCVDYVAGGRDLYALVTDADGDTMNATWHSNSSGAWVQFASNNSISNNTNITQKNTNFTTAGTTYYWNVSLNDGMGGYSNNTYHFKICVNSTWNTISTWNLTISNVSNAWVQQVEWNLTISNVTAVWSSPIQEWNLTISDSSSFQTISTWNLTISNVTAVWSSAIDEWNLTLVNSSCTFQQLQEWNLTISDSSDYSQISEWNLTISNLSNNWVQQKEWNLTLSNTTPDAWQLISTWNLTISNVSNAWAQQIEWNLTLINGTGLGVTITITDEYATGYNIPTQPTLYATVNSTSGYVMNVTWKHNGVVLGTEVNVTNGTYMELHYPATSRNTVYTWTIQVNDGMGNYLNETHSFTTEPLSAGFGGGMDQGSSIMGIIGVLGVVGLIALLKRKKKHDEE